MALVQKRLIAVAPQISDDQVCIVTLAGFQTALAFDRITIGVIVHVTIQQTPLGQAKFRPLPNAAAADERTHELQTLIYCLHQIFHFFYFYIGFYQYIALCCKNIA